MKDIVLYAVASPTVLNQIKVIVKDDIKAEKIFMVYNKINYDYVESEN